MIQFRKFNRWAAGIDLRSNSTRKKSGPDHRSYSPDLGAKHWRRG